MSQNSLARMDHVIGVGLVMKKLMNIMTDQNRTTRAQSTPTIFNIGDLSDEKFSSQFTRQEFAPDAILGKLYRSLLRTDTALVENNQEFWRFLIRLATFFEPNVVFSQHEINNFQQAADWKPGAEVSVTKLTFGKLLRTFGILYEQDLYQHPKNPIMCFGVLMKKIGSLVQNVFE